MRTQIMRTHNYTAMKARQSRATILDGRVRHTHLIKKHDTSATLPTMADRASMEALNHLAAAATLLWMQDDQHNSPAGPETRTPTQGNRAKRKQASSNKSQRTKMRPIQVCYLSDPTSGFTTTCQLSPNSQGVAQTYASLTSQVIKAVQALKISQDRHDTDMLNKLMTTSLQFNKVSIRLQGAKGEENGPVIPLIPSKLNPGQTYLLTRPTRIVKQQSTTITFLQEPPHGNISWLAADTYGHKSKRDVMGPANPGSHMIHPPMAISVGRRPASGSSSSWIISPEAQLELIRIAKTTTVTMHTSTGTEAEPSPMLITGEPTLTWDGNQVIVTWNNAYFTQIPHRTAANPGKLRGLTAQDRQDERGAKAWAHLRVNAPDLPPVWLLDHKGEIARIVIKHRRLAFLTKGPNWQISGIGPYADHTCCKGSHVNQDGTIRCRQQPRLEAPNFRHIGHAGYPEPENQYEKRPTTPAPAQNRGIPIDEHISLLSMK